MRIDRIEIRHTKMELVTSFETSMGVETHEEHIIVRVDGEGVTGWGECVVEDTPLYSSETVQTAWHVLRDCLIPAVLGRKTAKTEEAIALWTKFRGHRMAKAGLESALWDALAKAKGLSLAKMLGGTRDRVAVGVSVGLQATPEALVKKVGAHLDEGYRRIKIKIAPGRDVELVKALRKAYPKVLLQVDANSAYELSDIDVFRAMDDAGLLLIEQPLSYEDIYDHSKLQRELKTAICLDESIHTLADARAALELNSCRVINIKPGRVGGFTESVAIHDYCASKKIPVWHGGMLESGIGRAGNVALASLPNFTLPGDISASKRYYREDIVEPEFVLNADSTLTVPTGPGIGVTVLMDRLDRVTVRREEFRPG
ncbi:MAG: o-succinylbenzoate synthase [Candidatus Aminicenantes bacterium]|nr:o-succinylbenzoate synthase [Candidatus Aminicenantes bacterium]